MSSEASNPTAGIGKALRSLRKRRGVTQTELAAQVGLTSSVISRYERESVSLSLPGLGRILAALKTDFYELADTLRVIRLEPKDPGPPAIEISDLAKGLAKEGLELTEKELIQRLFRFLAKALAEDVKP